MIEYRELDIQLRSILPNAATGIVLSYNLHDGYQEDPEWTHQGSRWQGGEDRKLAIETNRVWNANVFGVGIQPSIDVSASSLVGVLDVLLGEHVSAALGSSTLDEDLRRLLPNNRIAIVLSFNRHAGNQEEPYDDCQSYAWANEADLADAIETQSIWTAELFGPGIDPSVMLASSSLEGALTFLKSNRDVIRANQKREPSKKMSQRHIAVSDLQHLWWSG